MELLDLLSKSEIEALKQELILKIKKNNIKPIYNSDGPVMWVSDRYAGVWLEHTYDAVYWGQLTGDYSIAENQIGLFIKNQRSTGQFPSAIHDTHIFYSQLQECVSLGSLCLLTYEGTKNLDFLKKCYASICAWNNWLLENRNSHGKDVAEMYYRGDTGHDCSIRLDGMKKYDEYPPTESNVIRECPVLPGFAPDICAVHYGNLVAASEMARVLGKKSESEEWIKKAEKAKKAIFELCYSAEDEYFYDADKHGNKRKCKSISITNVLCEGVCEKELVRKIAEGHLLNPKEFWTEYPFPSVSIDTEGFRKKVDGNDWGYYTQALTIMRLALWMPKYGLGELRKEVLLKWLSVWIKSDFPYGQEVDPFTGEPSASSPNYSACILTCLQALEL